VDSIIWNGYVESNTGIKMSGLQAIGTHH